MDGWVVVLRCWIESNNRKCVVCCVVLWTPERHMLISNRNLWFNFILFCCVSLCFLSHARLICILFSLLPRMVHVIAMEVLPEERDRKYYADNYSCCPPPLFVILVTFVEVCIISFFSLSRFQRAPRMVELGKMSHEPPPLPQRYERSGTIWHSCVLCHRCATATLNLDFFFSLHYSLAICLVLFWVKKFH